MFAIRDIDKLKDLSGLLMYPLFMAAVYDQFGMIIPIRSSVQAGDWDYWPIQISGFFLQAFVVLFLFKGIRYLIFWISFKRLEWFEPMIGFALLSFGLLPLGKIWTQTNTSQLAHYGFMRLW